MTLRVRSGYFHERLCIKYLFLNNKTESVHRTLEIQYSDLWKYFGVTFESCDRSDIKMLMSMLLDSMKLEMPTMSMKRSINEDPDAEEEIYIKLQQIDTVCHARHILNIENERFPLTISLISNDTKYFGIKAVVFNRKTLREEGVFLKVDTNEWKLDDEYINALPRHKKKDKLKYFYSLPTVLEDLGFEHVYRNLKYNQNKVPFIETAFGELAYIDVISKKDIENALVE